MKGIIIAHPWKESFNHAIFEKISRKLEDQNKNFISIDLYENDFSPALSVQELSKFKDGLPLDLKVIEYQAMLKQVSELIIIFPIWWYSMPAILKGFFDKVLLKNFAYTESPRGLIGQLTHISKVTIITTSEGPTWYIKYFKGNFVKTVLIGGILKDIGIKNTKWINFPNIKKSSKEKRVKFLEDLNV